MSNRSSMARVTALLCIFSGAAWAAPPALTMADTLAIAMARNPQLAVQRTQVDVMQGRQLQEGGKFDWRLSAAGGVDSTRTPLSATANHAQSQTREVSGHYQAGLSRYLRSGATAELTTDAVGAQRRDSVPYGPQHNMVRLDLALNVPLARGRDGQAVTAYEDAAQLLAQAARFDLRDQVARTMSVVMQAYWTLQTRMALERVAASGVERSARLLQSIQSLVDAQERPRGDLVLLRADHADKLAAHEAAVLAVTEARQLLGRQLGLDAPGTDALSALADTLPSVEVLAPLAPGRTAALEQAALARRPDLQALALRQQAAQRHVHAARDDLKPQVDLKLGVGTAKASDGGSRLGFLGEPGRTASPSVRASLNFQFPLENSQARGALLERSALLTQLDVQHRDLAAGVGSGVGVAVQSLSRTGAQFINAQAALGLYEQAVSQEIVKQRNGIATLIDVINVESRYVNAQVNVLQLQLAYAQALARLRYESGTLLPAVVDGDDSGERMTLEVAELAGLGPLRTLLIPPRQ